MREVVLMGMLGDVTDDGGFFGPAAAAFTVPNSATILAKAQQVQNDPAALQQMADATGNSKATILAAAKQATGTTTPAPTGGGGMMTITGEINRSSAAGSALKVGVVGALGFGLYYVGKHRGWF